MTISAAGCSNKPVFSLQRQHYPRPVVRRSGGYTLIELLIVLVVIGVITSIATLSLSNFDSDPIDTEARKLRFGVELLSNEAIIRSETLALGFYDKGYVFFRLDEEGDEDRWVMIEDDRLLKPHEFAATLQTAATVEGVVLLLPALAGVEPQIFALPTGEITPFEYRLLNPASSAVLEVRFDALGRPIEDEEDGQQG
ncbi:MAG: prepilin-type N-terminal cleavage/methylation domain-containing protein [Thiolinea sp.]